jgi:4'-phosphopantetheinyl transferase
MPAGAGRWWAPGPTRPELSEGAVHVWRVELTAVGDELLELLNREERERAARLLNAGEEQLWAHSRGVLRELVGRYLRRKPGALSFAPGEHGKPELLDEATGSSAPRKPGSASPAGLSFNLSHSGVLALYAFTRTGAVGVDVEVARRAIDEIALAARTFGAVQARRLGELDPAMRNREFLRLWVRREAAVKCLGTGFGGAGAPDADAGELWMAELEVGARAAAAVALKAVPRELRLWDWRAAG